MAGIRETTIGEWLRPLGYLDHAARREGRILRNDEITLPQFWELLEATLADEGLPLGDEAEVASGHRRVGYVLWTTPSRALRGPLVRLGTERRMVCLPAWLRRLTLASDSSCR